MSGEISSVSSVAVTRPPITTMASGFWVLEPMPVLRAARNKLIMTMRAVITTGRTREATPSRKLSAKLARLRKF